MTVTTSSAATAKKKQNAVARAMTIGLKEYVEQLEIEALQS
jgi:hypothetical protein